MALRLQRQLLLESGGGQPLAQQHQWLESPPRCRSSCAGPGGGGGRPRIAAAAQFRLRGGSTLPYGSRTRGGGHPPPAHIRGHLGTWYCDTLYALLGLQRYVNNSQNLPNSRTQRRQGRNIPFGGTPDSHTCSLCLGDLAGWWIVSGHLSGKVYPGIQAKTTIRDLTNLDVSGYPGKHMYPGIRALRLIWVSGQ